jgi:hypothetical protein
VQVGLFDKLACAAPLGQGGDHDEPPHAGRNSVALDGFNLHAAVVIGADDDVSRERLVRYCARPAFALERLSLLPDGRIAYRVKPPRKGATHRILEPLDLLARIAALIPPPRHPFLRYHGVLAPSSKWRRAIVPRPDERLTPRLTPTDPHDKPRPNTTRTTTPTSGPPKTTSATPTRPSSPISPSLDGPVAVTTSPSPRAEFARVTAAHHARLGDGDLLARTNRLDWSRLLRRTFAADVLICPRYNGHARVIAAIHDPDAARRSLTALDEVSIPTRMAARHRDDDIVMHRDDGDSVTIDHIIDGRLNAWSVLW